MSFVYTLPAQGNGESAPTKETAMHDIDTNTPRADSNLIVFPLAVGALFVFALVFGALI